MIIFTFLALVQSANLETDTVFERYQQCLSESVIRLERSREAAPVVVAVAMTDCRPIIARDLSDQISNLPANSVLTRSDLERIANALFDFRESSGRDISLKQVLEIRVNHAPNQ